MSDVVRVLVVGCGNMGTSHGQAYADINGFEVVGVVNRSAAKRKTLSEKLGAVPQYEDFEEALEATRPDAVSINTYPDTHASYAIAAMEHGAHVFVEKPLAETPERAQEVCDVAERYQKKLVVGYILRHHPSWSRFIEHAQTLGTPLVMRMTLNQQSSGKEWNTHKNLMSSLSPIVDCGVHYVDVMCQMTRSDPVRVSAIGARLTDEVSDDMYNYGQLQLTFADGSVGWYEAGWGPMVSESAYFVKDVFGPKGSVSMVPRVAGSIGSSSDIDSHTAAEMLRLHYSALDAKGSFQQPDEEIDLVDEPNHQELCRREQRYFLDTIRNDLDLSEHLRDAINSLKIVVAADASVKTGQTIQIHKGK